MENSQTNHSQKGSTDATIDLKTYLSKVGDGGSFVIPNYQRGYIWGQVREDRGKDSVTYLMETLVNGYKSDKKDLFLQGVTVYEEGPDVTVVDGQQRTVFFYLLLKWLGYDNPPKISYAIRKKSNEFLRNVEVTNCESPSEDEEFQDIYFFKKSLQIFNSKFGEGIGKEDFLEYILVHVKFLYIPISKDKAMLIFSMMNGNKADMRGEELVKSELLRCSSLNSEFIEESENAMIRSRLAREWDQWLYWWNDDSVKEFFHSEDRVLGWLLSLELGESNVTFDKFRGTKLKGASVKTAKEVFKKLRLLQKSIEDAFNDHITYNYMGAILNILNSTDSRFQFLKWYFTDKREEESDARKRELKKYFDLSVIGVTHAAILNDDTVRIRECFDGFKGKLEGDMFNDGGQHNDNTETGYIWLLRCNLDQDCRVGRKFDFSIWHNRSLEHIFPKIKVGHKDEFGNCVNQNNGTDLSKVRLCREHIVWEGYKASEHSIGNLVLLYGRDNSKFGEKDFEDKKNIFFEPTETAIFKSRHLIHTISVFAHSKWDGEEIARHKKEIVDEFTTYYRANYDVTE